MKLIDTKHFEFEGKEYEIQVQFDEIEHAYSVKSLLNGFPANPYNYTVKGSTVYDFTQQHGYSPVEELIESAINDIKEGAWEQRPFADLTINSDNNIPQLVVEVKAKQNSTPEWAAAMRRNLYAHRTVPKSPFFLLVAPDWMYLWHNTVYQLEPKLPDFVINSKDFLGRYVPESNNPEKLSDFALTYVVAQWLKSVISSDLSPECSSSDKLWLISSGLYTAIKNGAIVFEPQS